MLTGQIMMTGQKHTNVFYSNITNNKIVFNKHLKKHNDNTMSDLEYKYIVTWTTKLTYKRVLRELNKL